MQGLFFPETILANGLAGVTVVGMDALYAGGEFCPTVTDLLHAGGIEGEMDWIISPIRALYLAMRPLISRYVQVAPVDFMAKLTGT